MLSTVLSLFGSDNVYKYACIALGVLCLMLGLKIGIMSFENSSLNNTITSQKSDIKELQNTIIIKRAEIETQNALIKQNETDYQKNLEEANKQSIIIKDRFKVIYKEIDTFKKDENATDCNNLRTFANSVKWVR